MSQAIWLPLLVVDLQDRWSSRLQDLTPRAGSVAPAPGPPPSLAATGPALTLPGVPSASGLVHPGLLLGTSSPGRPNAMAAITDRPDASGGFAHGAPGMSSSLVAPTSGAIALLPSRAATSPLSLQQAGFSRAELLGGPITLADLQEAPLPPMALAEQGRRALSGDPLASLPEPWREPMRQALAKLPSPGGASARLERARHIHVASNRVSRATEVPLALQADGSVDILSRPDNDGIVQEIRDWSSRQPPPAEGSMTPALVHLHPVPEKEVLRPSAAVSASATEPTDGTVSTPVPMAVPSPAPVAAPVPTESSSTMSAPRPGSPSGAQAESAHQPISVR
ncbi:MAG: hypothetical protein VKJ05_01760 [Synechococcaceae cyanobacterium]|nr:hypothetical protein [Synechococcaceae cyanobacterium]